MMAIVVLTLVIWSDNKLAFVRLSYMKHLMLSGYKSHCSGITLSSFCKLDLR